MLSRIECLTSLPDLLERMRGGDCAVLAGGTDFVPLYSAGAITASCGLDIAGIEELRRIEADSETVTIGTGVRLVDAASLDAPHLGAVSDGAALVGSAQTRARATVGGNVCRASPSGDTLAGMLVCEADFVLDSASGSRVVPARDFFVGPGSTVRRSDEVLVSVVLRSRDTVSAYIRSTVRNAMDLATVGVAVSLTVNGGDIGGARIAVCGAGPRPLLIEGGSSVLEGRQLHSSVDQVSALDELIQRQISPIDDSRGSSWYRRQLVAPVLRAALGRAASRGSALAK